MKTTKTTFKIHGDYQGQLVAIEECKDIPFQIKRVYYLFGNNSSITRGCHAHKSLQQVLVCVHGSCKIRLDDGKDNIVVTLEKPNEGLYVSNLIWREIFDFSSNAVLLVIASDYYDESDYIRNYGEFLEYIKDHEEDAK